MRVHSSASKIKISCSFAPVVRLQHRLKAFRKSLVSLYLQKEEWLRDAPVYDTEMNKLNTHYGLHLQTNLKH